MEDVSAAVIGVIAQHAKADPASVVRSTALADLKLELLDAIELIFALEERFNIEIPYNANADGAAGIDFTTAGDVIDAVTRYVAERKLAAV